LRAKFFVTEEILSDVRDFSCRGPLARTVPLIRAMSLVPAIRWLHEQGRSPEAYLRNAGLPVSPLENPLRPVPLLHVARLVDALECLGGPDVCCKIVSSASLLELALLGRLALGSRTPAEALERISASLPLFCSHENLSVSRNGGTLVVRHSYSVAFNPAAEHLLFQYAAAMADRLCTATGVAAPSLADVKLPPHPEHGIAHLDRWFGPSVASLPGHALEIIVNQEVADRRFPVVARDRSQQMEPMDITPLRGDGTLSDSVSITLTSTLDDGLPTIADLALASGMSSRSLQRRLLEEGSSFSRLLDSARRNAAMRRLAEGKEKVASVAAHVGYSRQASLTRAMRRWTGMPPIRFRGSGEPER